MGGRRSRQQASSHTWLNGRAHFLWTALVVVGIALAVTLAMVMLHIMNGTTTPEKY